MTNNAGEQFAKQLDQGFFEAIWGILSSGMSALSGWLVTHGWSVIGLGVLAIFVTFLATELIKAFIDWIRDPRRKDPKEMGDDTHKLLIRLAALGNGMWVAHAFGFGSSVGGAIGIQFDWFSAIVIGGLMNSGASAGAFHFWKWSFGPTDNAKKFRAILRIKSQRFLRVSEEEIAAAATEKQSPAQMAELRDALKDKEV